MKYYDFKAGNETYKLRLNMRSIVSLEKKLGKNPILVFINKENNNVPTIEQMTLILEAALQEYHNDVDAYEVFDSWLEDGHIVGEFASTIIELYKLCGLFKNEEEKN